jgi:hypothetical protein
LRANYANDDMSQLAVKYGPYSLANPPTYKYLDIRHSIFPGGIAAPSCCGWAPPWYYSFIVLRLVLVNYSSILPRLAATLLNYSASLLMLAAILLNYSFISLRLVLVNYSSILLRLAAILVNYSSSLLMLAAILLNHSSVAFLLMSPWLDPPALFLLSNPVAGDGHVLLHEVKSSSILENLPRSECYFFSFSASPPQTVTNFLLFILMLTPFFLHQL